MTESNIRKKAKCFIDDYSVEKSYSSLCDAAEKLGYVIAEYDLYTADSDEMKLAALLDISKLLYTTRGMTYACGEYRIIFIDDRLSNDEKTVVLAHELGHIVLGHMNQNYIIGRDVIEEYEAYVFAYFCIKK